MERTETFDVVVIGGGPHGATYASWIKQWRPETTVAVVERKATTGYKIGESLLSTATRSFIAQGLSMPVLRRLFGNKAGIRFWWTGPETDHLRRHVDVVDIEETFQVERRVLDLALQESARRRGVRLMLGTRVDLKRSDLGGEVKTIACVGPDGPFSIRCRMVCDASGPASVLARHLGYYRKAPEANDTFTTNAYYAYFRPRRDVPVPRWDEPATRHLCFPGGWTWFIRLDSWHGTPDENLHALVRHLLDRSGEPDEALPSRHALMERFGCTNEPVVSVGFVVRADRDETAGLSVGERFRYYAERHPAIADVLDHYELVEEPYGHAQPYGVFANLVHDSARYAGDGWCLVGDAAAFTNPLFSPGLNLGSGTCYLAAKATVEALDAGDCSAARFADYERYAADVYEAVLRETDLYHRAFDHVDSYEWALLLKMFFGAADVIQRDTVYSPSDPFVHDLLNPAFRVRVDAARAVLRQAETAGRDPAEAAADVRAVVEPFARSILARPDVQRLQLGDVFTDYDAAGNRVEKRTRRREALGFDRCSGCGRYHDRSLPRCPVCGTSRPARRRAA